MRLRPVIFFTMIATLLLAAVPVSSAESVERVVLLHELQSTDGTSTACHVTDEDFQTFRLSVREGDEVTLTVRPTPTNEEAHSLDIEGIETGIGPLATGDERTVAFTVDFTGSRLLVCDGFDDPTLRGTLVAREAIEKQETPLPLPLVLVALCLGAAFARRR